MLCISYDNVLNKTFLMYKEYLINYNDDYYFGGGVIGCLLFHLLILAFGKIGCILICICTIFIGLLFINNGKKVSFLTYLNKFNFTLKKSFGFISKYFSSLEHMKTNKVINYSINSSILSDIKQSSNLKLQTEISKGVYNDFLKYIKLHNLMFDNLILEVGYTSHTFCLNIIDSNDLVNKCRLACHFFEDSCFFIIKKDKVYFEVNNKFKELLTLKKALNQMDKNYYIPIGVDNFMDFYCINLEDKTSYLIAGDSGSGILNYIKCLISTIFFNFKYNNIITFIDNFGNFKELDLLKNYVNYTMSNNYIDELVSDICTEIERRKEIFNYLQVDNMFSAIDEIMKNHKGVIDLTPHFLFINTNIAKLNSNVLSKIDYIIKFGPNVGVYTFVISSIKEEIENIQSSVLSKICFYTKSLDFSLRVTNNNYMCMLQKKGDALYIVKDNIYHMQTPYISNYDYDQIIKKLI